MPILDLTTLKFTDFTYLCCYMQGFINELAMLPNKIIMVQSVRNKGR